MHGKLTKRYTILDMSLAEICRERRSCSVPPVKSSFKGAANATPELSETTLCSCLSTQLGSTRRSRNSVSLKSVKMSEEAQIPAWRSGFAFLGHTPAPVSTLTYLLSVWEPARGLECACVHVCWCGTPHYVLLHVFIDVFISVTDDGDKTRVIDQIDVS